MTFLGFPLFENSLDLKKLLWLRARQQYSKFSEREKEIKKLDSEHSKVVHPVPRDNWYCN